MKIIILLFLVILVVYTKNAIIQIGHLLPSRPDISHEKDALTMSARDLDRRGLLPPNVKLQ